jgi:hypothetical protein
MLPDNLQPISIAQLMANFTRKIGNLSHIAPGQTRPKQRINQYTTPKNRLLSAKSLKQLGYGGM